MALTAYKTYVAGEVLTASDLNASLARIHDNGEDLAFPATKAHDMNGYELILDADADTSLTADTDDRIDVRVSGTDVNQIGTREKFCRDRPTAGRLLLLLHQLRSMTLTLQLLMKYGYGAATSAPRPKK
jgi:hypothetical protein